MTSTQYITMSSLQRYIPCLTMCASSLGATVSWIGFAAVGKVGLIGQTTPN